MSDYQYDIERLDTYVESLEKRVSALEIDLMDVTDKYTTAMKLIRGLRDMLNQAGLM